MEEKHLEGLVRKGIGGFYTVETPQGDFTCTARGKFRKERISPYAGDRVRITAEEDGTVHWRKSCLEKTSWPGRPLPTLTSCSSFPPLGILTRSH